VGELCLVGSAVELPLLSRPDLLIPTAQPGPGEQYRFHFDMSKCIGCKCCVVACNEQNGNPASINWRRVGEIEGGVFPQVHRWHLSMGCNHCLEPSCLAGCPVEAYTKDALTGIVDHHADQCIGCQYCTWNCSYGVPQFNAERGVVGKCDMCHGRLNQGLAPACVNACPQEAIRIEVVDVARWRADYAASANAPGMPPASDSISTTRITAPAGIEAVARVDTGRVRPEHPHVSLVFLLVLTQMAVGAFGVLCALDAVGAALPDWAAAVPFLVAAVALAAAPAHLGRPIHAHRAWRGWRTSWLSREVIAFGVFGGVANAYAAALWLGLPFSAAIGFASFATGVMGVLSSARIYMVRARPAWNLPHTMAGFLLTGAALGPRLLLSSGATSELWVAVAAALGSVAAMAVDAYRFQLLRASDTFEERASSDLLEGPLSRLFRARFALAALSLLLLPFNAAASLATALASEGVARWLFFASVVPKGVASTYLTPGGRAR
jgi:DMSO reductase iron-sulfur subunit